LRGVRSPQALLVALAGIDAMFFWLARESYPVVAYGVAALFGIEVLVVLARYAKKGPEADRVQPALTVFQDYSGQVVDFRNVDADEMRALLKVVARFRRPLPPPNGIVRGSAADPDAIVEISTEEAAKLLREDVGEESGQLPPTTRGT
jgi:hypothetical protein